MRVLVAGAGGFIGSELTGILLRRGHSVVALGRTAAKLDGLPAVVEKVACDVKDRQAVARAAEDCDAVAHLALPDITVPYREAYPIWIGGTQNLLAAAVERGMKAFAIASGSVGTYRHEPGAWVDESAPEELSNRVTQGRGEADDLARAASRDHGLPVSVLRPPIVYGRGGPFGKYVLDNMRRGRYRVIGDGSNYTPWVHVEDCALAFALAMEHASRGETFIVADDTPITLREASDLIARALGVRRPKSVPPILAQIVVGKVSVRAITESIRLRNTKLKSQLGWAPRYASLRDGLPSVVA